MARYGPELFTHKNNELQVNGDLKSCNMHDLDCKMVKPDRLLSIVSTLPAAAPVLPLGHICNRDVLAQTIQKRFSLYPLGYESLNTALYSTYQN